MEVMNPREQNPETSYARWRYRFLQSLLVGACVFGLPAVISGVMGSANKAFSAVYIAAYLGLVLTTIIKLPYWLKAGILLALLFGIGVSGLLDTGIWGDSRTFMVGFIVLTTLLYSPRAGWVALTLTLISYTIAGWFILTARYSLPGTEVTTGNLASWLSGGTTVALIAAVLLLGIRVFQDEFNKTQAQAGEMLTNLRSERSHLEDRVAERTQDLEQKTIQLNAAVHMARQISGIKDLSALLSVVIKAITEQYGHYHAAIFLVDDANEFAYLQSASSAGGQRMLESGYRIPLSGDGIVETAATLKRIRILPDIDAETAKIENPDLPSTRSRVAFPLITRNRTIGILDIHSLEPGAFQQSDIEVLQIVVDQLTLAIENARLFSDMESIVQQLEQTASERTYQVWSELSKRRSPVYQYTPLGVQLVGAVPEPREDTGTLVVPIILRGRKIGRIHLKRKGATSGWLEQEQTMVQEVAAQVGLALENARLLEDAQTRASRERSIGEISARIGSAFDVDSILRTTAQEIGKALGDAEVQVHLRSGVETTSVNLRESGDRRDKQ